MPMISEITHYQLKWIIGGVTHSLIHLVTGVKGEQKLLSFSNS